MMRQEFRELEIKLVRGLLDCVVLEFLNRSPMHGYKIITSLRKNFGVYFGPSTIYPLLCTLEEKGYIESHWDLTNGRPRKVYGITTQGSERLSCTEQSLGRIYKKLTLSNEKRSLHQLY